jgi:hypothetical protein
LIVPEKAGFKKVVITERRFYRISAKLYPKKSFVQKQKETKQYMEHCL